MNLVASPLDTKPYADHDAKESASELIHCEEVSKALSRPTSNSRTTQQAAGQIIPVVSTLNSGGNQGGFRTEPGEHLVSDRARHRYAVRRLTPTECERLQGFPDHWTRQGENGETISDSARYRALGNAVAVPNVEWIARRMLERGDKMSP